MLSVSKIKKECMTACSYRVFLKQADFSLPIILMALNLDEAVRKYENLNLLVSLPPPPLIRRKMK